MLISDLDYLEVVAEETSVVGGIANANANKDLNLNAQVGINKNINSNAAQGNGNAVFIGNEVQVDSKNSFIQQFNTVKIVKGVTIITINLLVATK